MRVNKLHILLVTLLFVGCAKSDAQNQATANKPIPTQSNNQNYIRFQQSEVAKGIDQAAAIRIASAEATRTYGQLDRFKIGACENSLLWVVIFDNGGPEYYIGKESGELLFVQSVPQGTPPQGNQAVAGKAGITQARAIDIAKHQFVELALSYGDKSARSIDDFRPVACELSNSWRVFFDYPVAPGDSLARLPNINPPNYVIDKRSGEVLYTSHNPKD